MSGMTDDDHEMRRRLQQVATYRQVCAAVRAGAGHTLFNALLMGGLTYFLYANLGPHPFLLVNAAFAAAELVVGLWKKAAPTIEAVLMDGLLVGGFGLWVLGRQALALQGVGGAGRVNPLSIAFGVWWMIDAVKTVRTYAALRRAFPDRPTRDQIRWFDDLAAETWAADPADNDLALDLPTKPRLKGQLLGSTAFLVAGRGAEVWVAGAEALIIERDREDAGSGRRPATLWVFGQEFPPFDIDDASWDNYRRWAAENRPDRPAGQP